MKIFITGISKGLGKALVKECEGRGHEVWGVARSVLKDSRPGVRAIQCDISIPSDVERVYQSMIDNDFIPDAVILNAALMQDDFDGTINMDSVRETFEVNFFGNLAWVDMLIPHFLKRDTGGLFIHISSVSAKRAIVMNKIGYPASKAAMDMIFEGLRIQRGAGEVLFKTVYLGPIGNRVTIPFITGTYRKAAERIVQAIENKQGGNFFSYPLFAAWVYSFARIVPDGLVRYLIARYKKDRNRESQG